MSNERPVSLRVIDSSADPHAPDEELLAGQPPRSVHIVALNEVPFLPYVYGLLRIYAEQDPVVKASYRFPEPRFFRDTVAEIIEGLDEGPERPGVLALSCYVWNFRRHMKVARLCKERHPDTLVVVGGPHIPERVQEFFAEHPYVDVVVHAEGELPFQRLLRENLRETPDWSNVPSVSFVRDGEVVTTERKTLPRDIVFPSPYLAGYLESSMDVFRRLGITYDAPWETNRGCPYRCSYCDWGSATMSKIRSFDLERLEQEIDYFGRAQVPTVHINDANFGILRRDLQIAERLVRARREHGFPRTVRLNFAKNSNDRVFEISKIWVEHDMLASTTLSMQATNDNVLAAIERENIGIKNYRELQARYSAADITTYTEIILGLPEETRDSFKSGLDTVLEMGNHDDVRVYELSLLPNAPITSPETVAKYGLKTVEKHVSIAWPGMPRDEIECIDMVVETNTMSREDWVDCSVYSRVINLLHNGCYTRYLAIYLRREHQLPYHVFYDRLQRFFLGRPDTLLGRVLGAFQRMCQEYQQRPELPGIDMSNTPRRALPLLEARRFLLPVDWGWVCISACLGLFYEQLGEYLRVLEGEGLSIPADLLDFQRDVMLQLDYDPAVGRRGEYRHDFPTYFTQGGPLRARQTGVWFRDAAMGLAGQYPLVPNDPVKFLDAALGGGWSDVGCRFYHRLSAAEITYGGPSPGRHGAEGADAEALERDAACG